MTKESNSNTPFTIITASLNHGRFLGDCLESVARQSGVSLEHFVIDGGSTDDSAEVAAKFPHATWIQEADEGMSDAINKGFDRAKGEWVMWMNADDRLKLGSLEKMVAVPDKTNADVVYGDWDFIDEKGGNLKACDPTPLVAFCACASSLLHWIDLRVLPALDGDRCRLPTA